MPCLRPLGVALLLRLLQHWGHSGHQPTASPPLTKAAKRPGSENKSFRLTWRRGSGTSWPKNRICKAETMWGWRSSPMLVNRHEFIEVWHSCPLAGTRLQLLCWGPPPPARMQRLWNSPHSRCARDFECGLDVNQHFFSSAVQMFRVVYFYATGSSDPLPSWREQVKKIE